MMHYLMLRSMKRRPKVHLTMLVLLICSFILPLSFNILKDSIVEGRKQQQYADTRGAHYIVNGAQLNYLPQFQELDGLRSEFYEGRIFLYLNDAQLADEAHHSPGILTPYENAILDTLRQISDPAVYMINYTQFDTSYADEQTQTFASQLDMVIMFAIISSVLLVFVAYRIHMQSFLFEIRIYISLGATSGNIAMIFFAELIILSALSCAIGLFIACGSMYGLMKTLLSVRSGNIAWMVFHLRGTSILQVIGTILFALCLVFIVSMRQFAGRMPALNNGYAAQSGHSKRSAASRDRLRQRRSGSLNLLLLKRGGRQLALALFISIPALILFVFLFNYADINAKVVKKGPGYDIVLSKRPAGSDQSIVLSTEDISYLISLAGNDSVYLETDAGVMEYLIEIDPSSQRTSSSPYTIEILGSNYLQTLIRPLAQETASSAHMQPGQILVNKNQEHGRWKTGDTLRVFRNRDLLGIYVNDQGEPIAVENPRPPKDFLIVGLDDSPYVDGPLRLYLHPQDYKELTDDIGGYRFAFITASSLGDYESILRQINQRFGSLPGYTIQDARREHEQAESIGNGIYVFLEYVLLILFIVVFVAVGVVVSDHMRKQSDTLSILYHQGAPKKSILKSYIEQALLVCSLGLFIAVSAGFTLTVVFFQNTGYTMHLSAVTVFTYAACSVIYVLAFVYPVHLVTKRQLDMLP